MNSDIDWIPLMHLILIGAVNDKNNFENGLSSTIGFDYKIKSKNSDFDFSVAQIINNAENKKMHPVKLV